MKHPRTARRAKPVTEEVSPPPCCDAGCTTRAQMRERHGIPDKFALACFAAVPGFIGVDEANAGITRYIRIANLDKRNTTEDMGL